MQISYKTIDELNRGEQDNELRGAGTSRSILGTELPSTNSKIVRDYMSDLLDLLELEEHLAFQDMLDRLSEVEIVELTRQVGDTSSLGDSQQRFTIECAALMSLSKRSARPITIDKYQLLQKYELESVENAAE